MKAAFLFVTGLTLTLAPGCVSKRNGYTDVNEKLIVGSRWSDTDNQEVAREIVKKALASPWLGKAKGGAPRVGVGKVKNLTSEEIDATALVNFMQDELINSGKVEFIANDASTREDIDAEVARQETHTTEAERTEAGQQSGMQYIFQGDISAKTEQDDDVKYVNYQANFRLVNLKTSKIEWSGQHRLRKKFER
jgi:uncharacterized protein (TIGR02722 family)